MTLISNVDPIGTLKTSLASTTGASQIGTTSGVTVQERLDGLDTNALLNIAALRARVPTAVGERVYVNSAANSLGEVYTGGGTFTAVDNTGGQYPHDGGIRVHPTAGGNLVWVRANFLFYDMRFWGVKADGVTDNAAGIAAAMNFARTAHVIIDAPSGSIRTSEMVPIYSNSGLRGAGIKAEGTVFYKTTNNAFPFKNGATTVATVDALVGFVPNAYDRADSSMASYCVHARLEGVMFRRNGLTEANVATTKPAVGLFMNKTGACIVRQVTVGGGYIGVQSYNSFSGVMEMVSATQWPGHGYAGFSFSDYRDGVLHMSGTSMDMRLCQTAGYQFGFDINRLQYTTMSNCTAENITPNAGETVCYAFSFIDPYSIVMNTCATEFVKGGQIRVAPAANPSFARSLIVNGYLGIDQQNAVSSTPLFYVDSGGGAGTVNVLFNGGDLSRLAQSNNTVPVVAGTGAKVVCTGTGGENWTATGGGVFTRLA